MHREAEDEDTVDEAEVRVGDSISEDLPSLVSGHAGIASRPAIHRMTALGKRKQTREEESE